MGVMDNLQNATKDQKAAALSALAQGGQRGLDAYTQSLGGVNSAQQTAMDRVAGHSGYLGDAAQGELQSIVAQPGDAARTALQQQMGSYQMANQERQNSLGSYFDAVGAAVPLSKQYGDNQIGLAKQSADAAAAAKRQEMAWTEEQHGMEMQSLAMQQEMRRLILEKTLADAGGASKDPFTDAQKAKYAANQTDEQRVADMQQQMNAQVAAENQRATQASLAQESTMQPDLADLDRMGGPGGSRAQSYLGRMNDARSTYQMSPLKSLFDNLPQAGRVGQTAASPAQSGQDVSIDELSTLGGQPTFKASSSWGGLGSALAAPGLGAKALGSSLHNLAGLSAARGVTGQHNAAIAALTSQMDPYQKVQQERQTYIDTFGDDPVTQAKAVLSYPYPTQDEVTKQNLTSAQLQEQAANYDKTGYTSDSAQLAALRAEQGLSNFDANPDDEKLAQSLGLSGAADIAQVRDGKGYQAAEATYQNMAQAFSSKAKNSKPPTQQDLKAAVMAKASKLSEAEQQDLLSALPVLLSDLNSRGLLFSDAYATNNGN